MIKLKLNLWLEISIDSDSASSGSISPDSMLKLQVGDLASAEQLQLPLCTVCNSGRPIGGPHATQCVICRQSRRRGNKNARGSIGNRGNQNARGTIGNRGNTRKDATKVEAAKKGNAIKLRERDLMKKWNTSKKKSCNCPDANHKDQCFMKWHGNGPRPYYGEDVLERHEAEWLEERKRLEKKCKT